jgi:hypothetical protein
VKILFCCIYFFLSLRYSENSAYGDPKILEDDILKLKQEIRLLQVQKKTIASQVLFAYYKSMNQISIAVDTQR